MGPCQCECTVDNNPALQNRGGIRGQYCHMSLQVNMAQGMVAESLLVHSLNLVPKIDTGEMVEGERRQSNFECDCVDLYLKSTLQLFFWEYSSTYSVISFEANG